MTGKDPFRTRDHVPEFDAYVARYERQSAATRELCDARIDIAYGETAMERLDLFLPRAIAEPAPVHLFIHGGYWRMFDKADFSFVANTVLAAGGLAAIVNYALMPDVRMKTIVEQIRRASKWVVDNVRSYGGDPANLTVSGHSAGGHLCCYLMTEDSPVRPRAALSLSGLYDLAPLRQSFLQPLIGLTGEEADLYSPLGAAYRKGSVFHFMVGEKETAPFHEQANTFRSTLAAKQCKAELALVPDADHMSIVLDLGGSSTLPGQKLSSLVCP